VTLRALYEIAAPAKLNLFLHVVGKRADGYHLLRSLFVLIDWCDTLHIERRNDGALARHDLTVALPPDDLCLRAARALQRASGTAWGADISIDKRVPWGAGLGGGSSDAASTLVALNRLWSLHWSRARLLELALSIGADVPFFIGGRNALVEGIGERLSPVAVPARSYAVVKPAASLETRAVFTSPLLVLRPATAILESFTPSESLSEQWTEGVNDLQRAAEAACTGVGEALGWLQRHFGNGRMTGSGSAVFAGAGASASMLPRLPDGWSGRMCRSLEAHPLAGWARD
jgi:4-diphosphocytidyl-2-C-methyl-D-erythritol kinase